MGRSVRRAPGRGLLPRCPAPWPARRPWVPRAGHDHDPVRASCLARVAWRHAGDPEKMAGMDIRAVRMQDVPQIAVVHMWSWQAAYRGLLPQAYLDGLDPAQRISQWERIVSAAGDPGGGTLVADAGGQLCGFVSYGPARDDDAGSRRPGEIYAIYPAPAAWDEGTGRRLTAAALGRLGEAGFGR